MILPSHEFPIVLMVGTTLSHYRIEAELGRGGMGVVYRAHDTKLDRTVALKFLAGHLLNDATARERFVREARAAAMLRHDNICAIYEVQDAPDGGIFIVMPLYEGRSLREIIDEGPIDSDRALEYARQTAAGLHVAASKDLVHRDIKPGNLLVTDDDRIKILDFGLAKHADSIDLTDTRGTVGTMAYMSPEQIQGETVDFRSDLWSLGVVLYEMLTGRKPFDGSYEAAIIYSIVNQEIDLELPEISDSIRPVLTSLLRKTVSDRIQSASALLEVLSGSTTAGSAPAQTTEDGTTTQISGAGQHRRTRWIVPLGAIASLIIAAFVWNGLSSSKSQTNASTGVSSNATVRTLAVMPFENGKNDAEVQFLCDGIAESLINWLAGVPDVKVISKSASFRQREHADDSQLLSETLGIDGVIRGRLDHVGEQIVISVSYVNTEDDTQLWGERIVRADDEVLFLERSIVSSIQEGLQLQVGSAPEVRSASGGTDDPKAYEHYLRGHFLIQSTNEESIAEGLRELRNAIALDSRFARPYADIADAVIQMVSYGIPVSEEVLNEARDAAYTAVALAPELPEAQTALATTLEFFVFDWERIDAAYEAAIALSPESPVPFHRFADYLGITLRFDRAREMSDKAIEIDPLDSSSLHSAGWVRLMAGNFSEAAEAFEEWNRFHPDSRWSYVKHAVALALDDRCAESLAQIEVVEDLLGDSPPSLIGSWMAWSHKICGRDDRYTNNVTRIRQALDENPDRLDAGFIYFHALEGDTDSLVDFVVRVVETKSYMTGYMQLFGLDYLGWATSDTTPVDLRYRAMVEQLNFPPHDLSK